MTLDARPYLFLDYDDTIGGVEIDGAVALNADIYDHVLGRFRRQMIELGYDGDRAIHLQNTIDVALCQSKGFGDATRFAQSLQLAYMQLMDEGNGVHSIEVLGKVYALGMSVFAGPFVPLPGAGLALGLLNVHYRVVIVTKGSRRIQEQKIRDAGLWNYQSEEPFVVDHKSEGDWRTVFNALRLSERDLTRAWAVGNSLKSDVNVPVTLGTNGIHLTGVKNWSFEQAAPVATLRGQTVFEAESIAEAALILLRHVKDEALTYTITQ